MLEIPIQQSKTKFHQHRIRQYLQLLRSKPQFCYTFTMKDLIILSGAPGSGKSTIAELLQKELQCPYIDFGWLREFHLKPDWSDASEKEEGIAFDNLVYILRNYIKNGYKNILVSDLTDERVQMCPELFSKDNFVILSLVVDSDKELKNRITIRNSGFVNTEKALAWNQKLKERKLLKNEYKIDNTENDPRATFQKVLKIIQS
ncbi:MAG: AAA family ATPase [Candidatus Pacebacteria bacterium]|nr:AAA family ATPase [Candidatus Paceibacterota bacterium]MDD5356648.1 AAA family ATPase [Candidatus Paceibacterota bacterium]